MPGRDDDEDGFDEGRPGCEDDEDPEDVDGGDGIVEGLDGDDEGLDGVEGGIVVGEGIWTEVLAQAPSNNAAHAMPSVRTLRRVEFICGATSAEYRESHGRRLPPTTRAPQPVTCSLNDD